jgi:hypothetical protein
MRNNLKKKRIMRLELKIMFFSTKKQKKKSFLVSIIRKK